MKGFRRKCGINYLNEVQTIARAGDRDEILIGNSKLPLHWHIVAPLLLGNQCKPKRTSLINCNMHKPVMNVDELTRRITQREAYNSNLNYRMSGAK